MLFAPDLHEPVIDAAWDPERVRAGIRAIADDAETAFDDGWLMHPSDDPTPDDIDRPRNMYYGGAGVVRALTLLAERDLIEPGRDYVPYLDRPFTPDCASLDHPPSLWGGETGDPATCCTGSPRPPPPPTASPSWSRPRRTTTRSS